MDAEEDRTVSADGVTCAQCGAKGFVDATFCTGCGAPLAAGAASPPRARWRRAAVTGDAAERAHGRREFARVRQAVLTMRSIFWAGAAAAVVYLVPWHLLVRPAFASLGSARLLVDALLWGEALLNVAGALLVLRAPLPWTIVGASAWTLGTATSLWVSDFAFTPWQVVRLLGIAAFWAAVAQAARVQRLMAADPTLQLVRKKIDPSRRVVGGIADEARARQRAHRRAVLRVGALGVGIVAAAIAVLVWVSAPPAPDGAVERFAHSWRERDAAGITAAFVDGTRGRAADALLEQLERRGWRATPPELGAPVVERSGAQARVTFPCAGGELRTGWRLDGDTWHLDTVSLPPFAVADTLVAAAVTAFTKAWAAPGTAELLALLRAQARGSLGPRIERLLERRAWQQRRPPLGEADVGRAANGKVMVTWLLGGDELSAGFEYWHPHWHLNGLALR
jgi:hypothetical protein